MVFIFSLWESRMTKLLWKDLPLDSGNIHKAKDTAWNTTEHSVETRLMFLGGGRHKDFFGMPCSQNQTEMVVSETIHSLSMVA